MRRIEGADKVSGALTFTEDMALPGTAHAKLVRQKSNVAARNKGHRLLQRGVLNAANGI